MSDDDPDLAPGEWSQPAAVPQGGRKALSAAAAAESPPPPPFLPKVLPAGIRCSGAERAQEQAWT